MLFCWVDQGFFANHNEIQPYIKALVRLLQIYN